MTLGGMCYRLTKKFPKEEHYGMAAQIRRSAASVPANIAEGYACRSRGEYIQFLRVAQGSLKELETHLMLSQRVQLAPQAGFDELLAQCEVVGKMLLAPIRSLQK
jgi:four helix bundle protein